MGNSANTPQNYKVLGQAPLDAKILFTSKNVLLNEFQANPIACALTYYKGMVVYLADEEAFYIWERPFSPFFKNHSKLLPENYVYPPGSTYDGINYEGEAYNFIEFTYRKEFIGNWNDSEKIINIVVYGNGTQTPFTQSQILTHWPNATKVSFIAGDLTGIKLFGQNVNYYEPINIDDWDDMTYDVWNTDPAFLQEVRVLTMEAGDTIDPFLYQARVIGNSFKEIKIITNVNQIRFKNSLYLKKEGLNFIMYVTDNSGVARQIGSSGGSGGGVVIDWGDISNIPSTFPPSAHDHQWNEIQNKPSTFPPNAHNHDWSEIDGKPTFHVVATSGDYNDLNNKPTSLPPAAHTHSWTTITNKPTLFSGSYTDLTNIPSSFPPSAHTHDWADISSKPTFHIVSTSGNYNDLNNKPTLFSGAYADLTGVPTSFTPSSHSHGWTEITGKPNFATVATSGSYNDLSNKPTIPAAQVQTNWNATSGMGMILNKPSTFPPSAHTHSWTEITSKPSTFPPSAHTHAMSDVTGLITELNFKVNYSEVGQPNGIASLNASGLLTESQRPPMPSHTHYHSQVLNDDAGNAFLDQWELNNQMITLNTDHNLKKLFLTGDNEILFDVNRMDEYFECMIIAMEGASVVFTEDKDAGIKFMLNDGKHTLIGPGSAIVIRRADTTQFVLKGDLS